MLVLRRGEKIALGTLAAVSTVKDRAHQPLRDDAAWLLDYGRFFDAARRLHRDDHIVVRPRIKVLRSGIVGTEQIDGIYPSDHAGIHATLRLKK